MVTTLILGLQKHLSNTLDLPSLKRLRVSAKEFPQQLASNRKPFLTVPRYTTILMRRWRTTTDEKALEPRCPCLVAQREKRAYSRRRTGSGHTGRIPK